MNSIALGWYRFVGVLCIAASAAVGLLLIAAMIIRSVIGSMVGDSAYNWLVRSNSLAIFILRFIVMLPSTAFVIVVDTILQPIGGALMTARFALVTMIGIIDRNIEVIVNAQEG